MPLDGHDDASPAGSRRLVLGAAGLHLAMLAYAMPLRLLLGPEPLGGPDYHTHFQHTHTLTRALTEHGRLWIYDPMMIAGYPAGLFFDVDNKAHFWFTTLLHRLGAPLPAAFNLFGLVSALLMPISLWLAARLLGASPRAQAWSFALAVLLWHFDAQVRFYWGVGMVSFATASHLCVLVLALFYRHLRGPAHRGVTAGLFVALPAALLTHAWSFAVLVAPMLGLYVSSARRLRPAGHLTIWLLAAVSVAVNAYWLFPALAHSELLAPSLKIGQATPAYIAYDAFEVFVDPLISGLVPHRTLVRCVALLAALGTLLAWRRRGDARLRYAGLSLLWLFALTYFGALVPVVAATEPYRFVSPMACLAAVLAGPWLAEQVRQGRWAEAPVGARTWALAGLFLLAPRLYGQVTAFVPQLDLSPPSGPAAQHEEVYGTSVHLRSTPESFRAVASWLKSQPDEGRVLVQFFAVGEYLRWATDRPIIGGFPDRRSIHEQANLFHHGDDDTRFRAGLADYLRTYNVAYVVMALPYVEAIERRPDLLEPRGTIPGAFRMYRVRQPSGYVARGRGRVRADLGRIEVEGAEPSPGTQELSLRFHWLREFQCRPTSPRPGEGCRVEREEVPGDEAGFIKVVGEPTLPAAFVIEQR